MDSFCRYFAEEKPRNTIEEIERKREHIIRRVEEEAGKRITVSNLKQVMTPEMLMKIIDMIDEEFFENKLQKAFSKSNCVLTACIDNKCTSVAGRCYSLSGGKCHRLSIKLMSKVFLNSFKKINITQRAVDSVKCNNILECFILTLEHELTHAVLFCKCKEWERSNDGVGDWTGITRPGNGHSKTFMSILFNVFGHTTFTHDLTYGMRILEADEKEYTLDELHVGDNVIVNVRIKGNDTKSKFLATITDINRRRKVKNNIYITVQDGDDAGRKYIVSAHHIVKKIGKIPEPKTEPIKKKVIIPKKKTPERKTTQKAKPSSKPKSSGKCTKRNPDPPCQPGYTRKKRPNGAECCYKGQTKKVEKKHVDFKNLDPEFDFVSKPHDVDDISKYSKPINYNKLKSTSKKAVDKLKRFNWNKNASLNEMDSLKDVPENFILNVDGVYLLVDTQGFTYVRYAGIIENLPNPLKGIKDIFKNDCTLRNPDPPCKEGFEERKRPNGSTCCYKSNTKTRKNQKKSTKSKTSKCNKRNPDPPCGPGMHEKKRPNGATCCYKNK